MSAYGDFDCEFGLTRTSGRVSYADWLALVNVELTAVDHANHPQLHRDNCKDMGEGAQAWRRVEVQGEGVQGWVHRDNCKDRG